MVRFLVRAVLSKETDHLVVSHHGSYGLAERQGEQHRPDRGKGRESAAKRPKGLLSSPRISWLSWFFRGAVWANSLMGHHPARRGDDVGTCGIAASSRCFG